MIRCELVVKWRAERMRKKVANVGKSGKEALLKGNCKFVKLTPVISPFENSNKG